MAAVDPVPGAPAAVSIVDGEQLLLIADYHAGIEAELRAEGVELDSRARTRRQRVLDLITQTDADRLIVLGDLGHTVGNPGGSELAELEDLVAALPVPLTLIPGNHDGGLGNAIDIEVMQTTGVTQGGVGMVHGHSWPTTEILQSEVVCMGHEHPMVRLADEVGGSHIQRVWLRGPLVWTPFSDHGIDIPSTPAPELVVFPAFNELSGGTWVNVDDQTFLSPYLPAGLPDGRAYLLDGTDLGRYATV